MPAGTPLYMSIASDVRDLIASEALGPHTLLPSERELAEQVAYLKAKVAYLEKLRALRASKSRGASEAPSSDCSQGGDTGSTTS